MISGRGKRPLFSVVIPCRDDQEGLDNAIRSVLQQTIEDLEVIVVDDGSTPCLAVETGEPRVRLLRKEVAEGPGAARNVGIKAARGRIIAFCDSDDAFDPRRLEVVVEGHRLHAVVVCQQTQEGAAQWLRPNRPRRRRKSPVDETTPSLGATSIVREACPRFDEHYLACQDVEWWIRVRKAGISVAFVGDVGYIVRQSSRERVLNSGAARLEFSYELLDEHEDFFQSHRRARAFRWLRIAIMERRAGNLALARRALRRSASALPIPALGPEVLRWLWGWMTSGPPPERRCRERIPPLARGRGRRLTPLRVGTEESRLQPRSRLLAQLFSLSSHLPRTLRGPLRKGGARVLERGESVALRSAWGTWLVEPSATRALARCADEVLETSLVARLLRPGDRVIDIGANRGWYTLVASARVGSGGAVVAVDPDPRMTVRLQELVERNKLDKKVRVIPAALGEASGTAGFVLHSNAALSHLVADGDEAPEAVVQVAVVSFRELMASLDWDRVEFVKVDVEGAERAVIASIREWSSDRSTAPTIMFEYEAENYVRAGSRMAEIIAILGSEYIVFGIDYDLGGLRYLDESNWVFNGRNVMALPRPHVAHLLRRMSLVR